MSISKYREEQEEKYTYRSIILVLPEEYMTYCLRDISDNDICTNTVPSTVL